MHCYVSLAFHASRITKLTVTGEVSNLPDALNPCFIEILHS